MYQLLVMTMQVSENNKNYTYWQVYDDQTIVNIITRKKDGEEGRGEVGPTVS